MGGKVSKVRRKWRERRIQSQLSSINTRLEREGLPPNILHTRNPNVSTAGFRNTDRSAFCQRCNEREYPLSLLDIIEGWKGSLLLSRLAFEPETKTSLSCSFCGLLESARRDFKEYPRYDGAYYYISTDCGLFTATDGHLPVLRISKDLRISRREPQESCTMLGSTFQKAKDRRHVDLSVFRRHIETCQTTHEECSLQTPRHERVIGLRVIDCQSREIVQASDGCRYAALSYVWGSQALGSLRDPPRTISDAMSATLGLGLRFLWVDRYCINQDSTVEKHAQIQQMGLIYSQAQVTLIAAAGHDPSYGLPGISTRNQREDVVARIGRFGFSMMPKTPQELLSKTLWVTRGWTYQEFLLSERRLVFTDELVFLECQASTAEEWPASAWKYSYVLFPPPDMVDDPDSAVFFNDKRRYISQSYTAIRQYAKRKLTYQSDALNGILGILARFEHGATPVYHLWGLPYDLEWGKPSLPLDWWCSIDNAAYMRCSKAIVTRRRELPSWSWTGWEAVPFFGVFEGHSDATPHHNDFPLIIEAELEKSGQLLTLKDFAAITRQTPFGARQPVSRFLRIEGWTHSLEFDRTYTPLESDFYGPRVRLWGTDHGFMATMNAAFPARDLLKGMVDVSNLRALLIRSGFALVLGDTSVGTERLGIARIRFANFELQLRGLQGIHYMEEDDIVAFQREFPLAKKERFRLC